MQCEDLVKTERLVLRCVSWRIQLPTSYTFLSIFKHALALEPRTVALACYLLVRTLCCAMPRMYKMR